MSNTLQIKRGLQVNLPTGLAGELLFTTDTKRLYISDGAATNLIQGASTVLTTGAVPFSDANGKITMDATKLYWDNTNKRLGIGTATPGYALDVNSTSRITQSNAGNTPNLILATPTSNLNLKFFVDQIAAYDSTTSSALYLNYNGGDIGLGGTKATLKYGTGNFLIGTTTDGGARLLVKGTGNTSATTSFLVQDSSGQNLVKINDNGAMSIGLNSSPSTTANSLVIGLTTTNDQLTITNSTFITSLSTMKLAVNGSTGTQININGLSDCVQVGNSGFGVNATPTSGVQRAVIKGWGSTSATTTMLLQNSSSTNLLIVRDDGNVGIGTASPSYKLDINGTARVQSTDFIVTGSNSGGNPVRISTTNTDSTGVADAFFFNSAGNYFGAQMYGTTATGTFANVTNANLAKFVTNASNFVIGTQGASPIVFAVNALAASGEVARFSSTGNFGIGTTSPGALLHVNGNLIAGASTTSGLFFNTANDTLSITNQRVLEKSASNILIGYTCDSLQFRTVSTERMRITSAGNVGIGTTAPSTILEANGIITSTRIGAASQYLQIDGGDAVGPYLTAAGAAKVLTIRNNSTTSSDIKFDQAVASPYMWLQAGVEQMRISSTGNVGIGRTSPSVKLDVNGIIKVAGNGGGYVEGYRIIWESPDVHRGIGGSAFQIENVTSQGMTFGYANNQFAVLNTLGNFGIGTTTPGRKLTVNGIIASQLSDANDIQGLLYANTTAVEIHSTYGSTGSYVPLTFRVNNAERMRIATTGNVLINTTTDAGYKLDVSGTGRFVGLYDSGGLQCSAGFNVIAGSGSSSGKGLLVGVNGLGVNGNSFFDGTVYVGGNSTASYKLVVGGAQGASSGISIGALFATRLDVSGGNNDVLVGVDIANTLVLYSRTGVQSVGLRTSQSFAPVGLDTTHTSVLIAPTINQTGGSTGITRGLYINPTLTAAASWRSVEVATGNVMFNTTSGNTIVGTTTDAGAKLFIKGSGTTSATTSLLVQNSGSSVLLQVNDNYSMGMGTAPDSTAGRLKLGGNTSTSLIFTGFYGQSEITFGAGLFFNNGSGNQPTVFQYGGSEQMRISSTGNVGIGTSTTTNAKLEVYVGSGSTSGLRIKAYSDAGTGYLLSAGTESYQDNFKIKMINGNVTMGTQLNGYTFGLYTFNGTALTVANSGNILIGTTTDAGHKLRITGGSARFDDALLINTSTANLIPAYAAGTLVVQALGGTDAFHLMGTGANNIMNIVNGANTNVTAVSFLQDSGATVVGSIGITPSGTTYNTVSDYRLKTDFKDFNGTDILSKINVYDFAWESDGERSYGVKAHELQSVVPNMVSGEKDAVKEDGTILPQQVDYSKLVPVLIKAIQELKEELDILKNK